ncbi:MAG: hypothetical protein U0936_23380 [Planctomycetaceae bacterium]
MVALFVLKLVAGVALMWLLMPRKEVTDGFFRIQMLVGLGLCVLAALTAESSTLSIGSSGASAVEVPAARIEQAKSTVSILKGLMIVGALTSYVGHIVWKLGRRGPGRVTIYLMGFCCVLSLALHAVRADSRASTPVQLASDFSSAGVLGAMLTGMLLGHWYLTTPTMSIQPLTWFAKTLFAAALLRMAVSGVVLLQFGWSATDTTHILWLSMRLIGGVLVPAVISLMVVRILRYRNTQSATGVLFAGLILVFMGEMTAALLERDLGIPY